MSGLLGKIEGAMGMGSTANDNSSANRGANGGNMDPSSNAQSAPGGDMNASPNTGNTAASSMAAGGYTGTDKYEPTIQQGESYVKSHYSSDPRVMQGEQVFEKVDAFRLGRNNMNNMETGVGGTIDSNPQHVTGIDRPGAGGSDYSKTQGGAMDNSGMMDKERIQYGADGGMGALPTGNLAGNGMQQSDMQGQSGMQQSNVPAGTQSF